MRALERRRPREHDVGVPRRLVHVDVHREHEVEALDRAGEATRVRGAHRRVPGDRHERPDLALAGRVDLLGEAHHGQFSVRLGQAAHAAAPATQLHPAAPSRRAQAVGLTGGGAREHRATRPVEVARDHVEHVHQPARQRPELLRAGPDAPVNGRTRTRRELAGHAPDRGRLDAAGPRDALGREVPGEAADHVEAVHVLAHRSGVLEPLVEDRVDQAE